MGENNNQSKPNKPRGYGHVLSTATLVSDPERFNRSIVSRFFTREELMRNDPNEEMEEMDLESFFPPDKFGKI